ncbi:MAG: DUF4270 domain-containing protein [Bacteroidia bacterium]|nr:DUF4270 domain-containing protein [Bacteroidia bacterium]
MLSLLNISYRHIILCLFLFSFFESCKKIDDIGSEALDPKTGVVVEYSDTTHIQVKTQFLDSIKTSSVNVHLFGNMYDPVMGHIDCATYLQFSLASTNLSLESDVVFDSLRLFMRVPLVYGSVLGKPELTQTLQIHEITEDTFSSTKSYYSHQSLLYNPAVEYSGNLAFKFPKPYQGDTTWGVLLDSTLGKRLLFGAGTSYTDNASFQNFFKGLVLKTQKVSGTDMGAIFQFYPFDQDSRLVLNYHKQGESTSKTLVFYIDSQSAHYHSVKRSEYELKPYGLLKDTTGNSVNFLVCGAYHKLFVKLSGLSTIREQGINYAELVIPVHPDYYIPSDSTVLAPSTVYPFQADSTQTETGVALTTSYYFDNTSQSYRVPITGYFQSIVRDSTRNTGLVLLPFENATSLRRAVVTGPGHPSRPIKLRLLTTRPPK